MSTLYSRITKFANVLHCGEWLAVCPECGWTICIYCEDECESCHLSLF